MPGIGSGKMGWPDYYCSNFETDRMPYNFQFSETDLAPVLVMVLATVSFSCYWLLFVSPGFKKSICNKNAGDAGLIRHILLLKYLGMPILALIPIAIFLLAVPGYSLQKIGIGWNPDTAFTSMKWILGLGIPILIFNWFAARRQKICDVYPQIRVKHWDASLMFRYGLSWAVYMLGYEMMFRGYLLFPLADSFGVWPAIAINFVLYTASHIPKGVDETYATMFFGPLMCYLTLQTGTIWAAWCIHTLLAVSNSMVALKFHPEFSVVDRRPTVTAV
jgi:membrane protease YdiL (CAAX protease family)